MHAIELSYHGIRFLQAQRIWLGEPTAHILLGGPNGSGKSTSFNAGALALGSVVIDPYSLRDAALPEADEWRAGTFWLFHNPPTLPDRPNADEYIQLGFELVQPPRQAVRIVWMIKEGPTPEKLTVQARFTDMSRYVDEIRTRYRIDPDRYAMFWYQSQITRFVDLNDEDKAREMLTTFELDTQERNWIEARRACRNAYDDLKQAEVSHRLNDADLRTAKTLYNRWCERQQGVESSLMRFLAAYDAYRQRLQAAELSSRNELSALRKSEEHHRHLRAGFQNDASFAAEEAQKYRMMAEQSTDTAQKLHRSRSESLKRHEELDALIGQREQELSALLERRQGLRPREVMEAEWDQLTMEIEQTAEALSGLADTLSELESERTARTKEQGAWIAAEERLSKEQAALPLERATLPDATSLAAEKRSLGMWFKTAPNGARE